MYEQHFGLNKRPFLAKAAGTDVFVGPQTASTMSGLKKALASQDAVIAVSGPAGSGKTTLVAKALGALSGSHKSVRIGRIQLKGTDALEFLLEELGVSSPPRGPIRQFAAFRAQLIRLEAQNLRLVVVVEDALRTGAETLSELEALTAADTGESGGAAIILLGDERLTAFCKDPQLARLGQRSRQRLSVVPLSAAELRGYLMHCFRLAGADFEFIFDARCAALVHQLSGGIPRIANKIVEAALTAAASSGLQKVSAAFVADIAKNEFELEAEKVASKLPPTEPEPVASKLPPTEPEPVASKLPPTEPVIVFSDEDDIPELIQDTLPDLHVLAPEMVAADDVPKLEPVANELPPTEPEPDLESLPTLNVDDNDVPAWERDPTLAQLKPDLDALEKAMAFANGDDEDDQAPAADTPVSSAPKTPRVREPVEEIPEITLDNAIRTRIEDNLIDEPGEISPTRTPKPSAAAPDAGVPEVRLTPQKAKKADAEIERIAAELAKAKTLEDVDDRLAETLFGEELNLIASQVIAAGARQKSANDEEVALFDTAAANIAQAAGSPNVKTAVSERSSLDVRLETRERGGEGGLDLSASQRLKTVRALNADLHPSLREPEAASPKGASNGSSPPQQTPESIEDQINTSMTQTLKALNVRPPISERNAPRGFDDDDDEKKGGFFSRFKR